ncbi:MAG: hypothetical protein OHK0048_24170 [Rhodoferax sp.]
MEQLLRDLARLSGLRDRPELAAGLVRMLARSALWPLQRVTLARAVGPATDQRWLRLAELRPGLQKPECDHVGLDLSHLPVLSAYRDREAAIVTESIIRSGVAPCRTTFPIDTRASVCSVLEVESPQALSAQDEANIDSLLRIYENLEGLFDYGEKDTLTELFNRKTFDGAFLRAASIGEASVPGEAERRADLTQGGYWLAVIDIDHFKQVNDVFGHLIGDEVLLLLARLMRTSFREQDQLYRFGGEEFVVLLRCGGPDDALAAMERFRLAVQDHAFPQVQHITVSVGLTQLRHNDTPSGAFDRADKAVYYAKSHGRNRVCSYDLLVAQGELVEPPQPDGDVDFF